MINQTPKSQRKKIIYTLIFLIFLSIVIFIFKNSPPIQFTQGVVQDVFMVPKSFFYSIGKNEKKESEADLKKQIRNLEQKIIGFEIMKSDNNALKSQFATSGETTQSMVAARIIGSQGDSSKPHQFIINVGSNKGIKKSMTVVFEKYLVGKIDEVTKNYSVVATPYNPKFQVLAKLPDTNANGIVIGRSDLMLFDGVIITDLLKNGGVVVTKGEVDKNGVGVVPDIIIGKISSISKRETAPFQSAQLSPLIIYNKLTTVFVISQM